ncbi:uncharacterized protein LOC111929308 [Cyanistes caeruleus]|uniref:uncharacterized protein LOC111929308 n=1 Tax=Cyanistes caeruleus TaxID=156563 RepID=UPI000CDA9B40|nr:uncharacterized protein LOC111929308 [Cyanistes caeruleus]
MAPLGTSLLSLLFNLRCSELPADLGGSRRREVWRRSPEFHGCGVWIQIQTFSFVSRSHCARPALQAALQALQPSRKLLAQPSRSRAFRTGAEPQKTHVLFRAHPGPQGRHGRSTSREPGRSRGSELLPAKGHSREWTIHGAHGTNASSPRGRCGAEGEPWDEAGPVQPREFSWNLQPCGAHPSPTSSPPWPAAPEEPPARPNTLDFSKGGKELEEARQAGQRRGSDRATVKENGVEATPATSTASSEERRALQSELGKCIEEFRRIKIPQAFPNKKRQWQSELLKKYQL